MSQKVSLTATELERLHNLYRAAWPSETKTLAKLDRAIQREKKISEQ